VHLEVSRASVPATGPLSPPVLAVRLRTALASGLRRVVRPTDELVILQSSLFHLAWSTDAVRWEAVAAVRALAQDGHTLALPAFTFSFVRSGRYHHRHTASGSGQLADWVYELPESRRTPHPVYSYVVLGPRRDELLSSRGDGAFGAGTVFELFEADNARIVMAGADWQALTQVHRYEELLAVPYRERMHIEGTADFGEGEGSVFVDMFVRDVTLGSVLDFTPVIAELRRSAVIDQAEVGRGTIEATSCDAVRAACRRVIGDDPYALVQRPRVIERRARRSALQPLRLAVVGAQNADLLAGDVRLVGEELLEHRPLNVFVPPFGQHAGQLLDPDSPLRELNADCTLLCDRLEDIYDTVDLDVLDQQPDRARLDSHLALLESYIASTTNPVVALMFADLRARPIAIAGETSFTRQAADEGNARLAQLACDHSNLYLLDTAALAAAFSGPVLDDRLWHVARLSFSPSFSRHLAKCAWGVVLAARGESTRLLAVDLDGTLWGGILGDDDVAGIVLGNDHPGNAFVHFQRALHALQRTGIAIALCSKNDEDHALRALRERPEMVLREQDLVGWRIGWRAKSEGLAELAAELGIDLEHVLFIDDSPVEREAMRHQLPAVKVLDLPSDPAGYVNALAGCPYLARLEATEEDRRRTERYRARAIVERERRTFADPEAFYASLGMTVSFAPLSAINVARAEQLAQKTNQFNMTMRRHRRRDLERLAQADNAEVTVIGLTDRFTDHEHIGLAVVLHDTGGPRSAEIDTLLLSCRVLGRGVEQAVLAWIVERTRTQGAERLLGPVVATPRNRPCRDLYRTAGFVAEAEKSCWRLDLERASIPRPTWLTVEADPGLR
jgi:FkbH-like protein